MTDRFPPSAELLRDIVTAHNFTARKLAAEVEALGQQRRDIDRAFAEYRASLETFAAGIVARLDAGVARAQALADLHGEVVEAPAEAGFPKAAE